MTTGIFFHYPKNFIKEVGEIYDCLKSSSNPWMDAKDVAPGEDWDEARKEAFVEAPYWVIFSDRPISEKEIHKIAGEYASDHEPELLTVVFLKELKTRYKGRCFILQDPAETATRIADQLYLSQREGEAVAGQCALITLNPPNAAIVQKGILTGPDFGGAQIELASLPSEVEFFNWFYVYTAITIKKPGSTEVTLERWKPGHDPIVSKSIAGLAAQCRRDLHEERFEEARGKLSKIRKVCPSWEMSWFLDGMLALRTKDPLRARFYFEVSLEIRSSSFPAAWFSAISLIWNDEIERGLAELEEILTNHGQMNDCMNAHLLGYPKEDRFLEKVRRQPDFEGRCKKLEEDFANFTLSQLTGLAPTPKARQEPLPLALRSFTIRNFQRMTLLKMERIPLHSQWIFLTGDNGEGKTSLLQALAVGFFGVNGAELIDKDDQPKILVSLVHGSGIVVGDFQREDGRETVGWAENVLGYGPARLDISGSLTEQEAGRLLDRPVHSLLHQSKGLLNIEQWLKDQHLKLQNKELSTGAKTQIQKTVDQVCETLTVLLPQVDKVVLQGDQVLYREKDRLLPGSRFSAGHLAIRAMFGDMMVRFLKSQPNKSFSEMEGLVLIDELENHFHVRWQFQLPQLLSKIFPKVQFIASTHSPVPLLGAPPNSLVWRIDHDDKREPVIKPISIELERHSPNNLLSSPAFGFDGFLDHSDLKKLHTEDDFNRILEDKNIDAYLKWAESNVQIPKSFFDGDS